MGQAYRRLLVLDLGPDFGLFSFHWHPSVLGVTRQGS